MVTTSMVRGDDLVLGTYVDLIFMDTWGQAMMWIQIYDRLCIWTVASCYAEGSLLDFMDYEPRWHLKYELRLYDKVMSTGAKM